MKLTLCNVLVVASLASLGANRPPAEFKTKELLGTTAAYVLEELGVPKSVTAGVGYFAFSFLGSDDKPFEIVFHHDRAIYVDRPEAATKHGRVPTGLHLGLPADMVPEYFGVADRYVVGPNQVQLIKAGTTVTLSNGIVVDITSN